jgi:hypothetical protein
MLKSFVMVMQLENPKKKTHKVHKNEGPTSDFKIMFIRQMNFEKPKITRRKLSFCNYYM